MAIRLLTVSFALFLFSASFSIALSQVMLGISAVLFVWLLYRGEAQVPYARYRVIWWLMAAYVLWECVTSLAGATPLRSLGLIKEDWLFLAVPIALFLFSDQDRANWLFLSFAIGLILLGTYGVLQHLFGLRWYGSTPLIPSPIGGFRVVGFFHHRLTLGNLMAVASVFCLALTVASYSLRTGYSRKVSLLAGCFAGIMTLLTFSRGPILALGIGCLVIGVTLPRRFFVLATVSLLVVFAVVVTQSAPLRHFFSEAVKLEATGTSVMSRQVIWRTTGTIIADYPFFGAGAGNFKSVYGPRLPSDAPARAWHTHPHNDLLNVVVTHGIFGGLIFALLWITLLWTLWRKMRSGAPLAFAAVAASVAFLITGLTEATFADEEVRQVLMALWGIGLAQPSEPMSPTPKLLDS